MMIMNICSTVFTLPGISGRNDLSGACGVHAQSVHDDVAAIIRITAATLIR